MKISCFGIGFLTFLLVFSPIAQGAEKVLIETDFSKFGSGGVPKAEKEIEKKSGFPLRLPTSHTDLVEFVPPSSVIVSKEAIKDLQPPFALVTVKRKAPANIKPGENPFAGAGLSWNFRKAPLGKGKYVATWTFLPITELSSMYMTIPLVHQNDDGSLVEIESLVHPTQKPLMLVLTKNMLIAPNERLVLDTDKASEFRMEFDLVKNTWGVDVNGKTWFKDKSLPDAYLNEFPTFCATSLIFTGGQVDTLDEVKYAIARVKLIKVDE